MFELVRMWLLIIGCAMALAGTFMVLIAGTPLFALVGRYLDRPFWSTGADETTRRFEAWAYSVTFATMAAWGLCVAFIAANAFGTHEAWAWWCIAASVAVWYPLDTGRSLYHRVYANAALNTAMLVAVAVPLVLTFGEFR